MPRHTPEHSSIDIITQNALACIASRPDYNFTVSGLADMLHVSASHLSPQTALECGFSDYAGFYRQYRKMFSMAPSESKVRR